MAMNLAPFLRQRYFDSNGDPLAGGKLYSYQAGTSTPQATYTNSGGGTANANPVVLDADGEAAVWLDPALSYKFVLKNSSDVEQWTEDNVVGQLSADAVATSSIQDSAVTTAKLADDSVTAAKLKDSASVDADRAVTTDHIRDAAVTRAKVATGAVAKQNVVSKTTTYTATDSDDVILCSASGGAWTLTLPASSTASGRVLTITRTDQTLANLVTVDGNSSETIDGATTTTLATQHESLRIYCDGSNWFTLSRSIPKVWTSFTPTIEGFGTLTSSEAWWCRSNSDILIRGYGVLGTPTAVSVTVAPPTGLALNNSKMSTTTNGSILGFGKRNNNENLTPFYDGTTTTKVFINRDSATGAQGPMIKLLGNVFNASDTFSYNFSVPITGWSG